MLYAYDALCTGSVKCTYVSQKNLIHVGFKIITLQACCKSMQALTSSTLFPSLCSTV